MSVPEPKSFSMARVPHLEMGAGRLLAVPAIAARMGRRALIVVGRSTLAQPSYPRFLAELAAHGVAATVRARRGEPSPEWVDATTDELRPLGIELVIAIGGGSALDAGKALGAMLPQEGSVVRFLEGVGTGEPHDGRALPMIAVPTSAGTGSEATKNAVLSQVGPGGFKRSLRHEAFVPAVAVIDPALMVSSPPDVAAACGMDALTQLLEAYTSTGANPMTDALAERGLLLMRQNLLSACGEGNDDLSVWGGMGLAAFFSGICLANAGLGIVHGLAGPLGGRYPAPHGAVCGTLLAAATRRNLERLAESGDAPARDKYAAAGRMLTGHGTLGREAACAALIDVLERWTDTLAIQRLGAFGLTEEGLAEIVDAASQKTNPAPLTAEDIAAILRSRL